MIHTDELVEDLSLTIILAQNFLKFWNSLMRF